MCGRQTVVRRCDSAAGRAELRGRFALEFKAPVAIAKARPAERLGELRLRNGQPVDLFDPYRFARALKKRPGEGSRGISKPLFGQTPFNAPKAPQFLP